MQCALQPDWEPTLHTRKPGEDPFLVTSPNIVSAREFFDMYPVAIKVLGSGTYGVVLLFADAEGARTDDPKRRFAIKFEPYFANELDRATTKSQWKKLLYEIFVHQALVNLFLRVKGDNNTLKDAIIPVIKLYDYGVVDFMFDHGPILQKDDAPHEYNVMMRELSKYLVPRLPKSLPFNLTVMQPADRTLTQYLFALPAPHFHAAFTNAMQQILITLLILQENVQFTHWDLLLDNIYVVHHTAIDQTLYPGKHHRAISYVDPQGTHFTTYLVNGNQCVLADFGFSAMIISTTGDPTDAHRIPGQSDLYYEGASNAPTFHESFDVYRLVLSVLYQVSNRFAWSKLLPVVFWADVYFLLFPSAGYIVALRALLIWPEKYQKIEYLLRVEELLTFIVDNFAQKILSVEKEAQFAVLLDELLRIVNYLITLPLPPFIDGAPSPRVLLTTIQPRPSPGMKDLTPRRFFENSPWLSRVVNNDIENDPSVLVTRFQPSIM